jgi:hypothetical protein
VRGLPIYLTSMPSCLSLPVTPYRSEHFLHASSFTPASLILERYSCSSSSSVRSFEDGPQMTSVTFFHPHLNRFEFKVYMNAIFKATSLSPLVHNTTNSSGLGDFFSLVCSFLLKFIPSSREEPSLQHVDGMFSL